MPSIEVDREKLQEWIESTFDSYKNYREDFLINSIFTEDKKHKLSISVSKKCYHCWKTDESGPLWDLICKVEGCDKAEAFNLVYEQNSIARFESKIESLKKQAEENIRNIQEKKKRETIDLPLCFMKITPELKGSLNIKALRYCIKERKIDPIKWKFGYCNGGKYDKRLIIPFYKNDKMIYWIARSLYGQEPKYFNPPVNDEEKDIKKEDIFFSKDWNFKNQDVIIVEGALDAIILIELGFNAVSIQGKCISETQLDMLKNSNIIFGFDNDEWGIKAVGWNMKFLNERGIFNIKHIFPPISGLDWNSCYKEMGSDLKFYVEENIKPVDFKLQIKNKLKTL